MKRNIRSIAIIGGGPSGCALATLLKRKGFNVAVFYLEKRPEIIVGESLLPAIIPLLRKLGVEDEVKSYSTYKPGASVWVNKDEEATSPFSFGGGGLPPYAYNVPRLKFDKTIFDLAVREGVTFFNHVAKIETTGNGDELKLADETIAATGDHFKGQPDLIVDATGRSRAISRLLNIPTKEGERKDVAIFAHLSNAEKIEPYNIHLHRLEHGWTWRIPLPDRTSVGVVIDPRHLSKYGTTREEQYDNILKTDEILVKFTKNAKRETGVVQYNNYQLISQKMYGTNWLLAGDAGGFLDPIFSSGLFLAIKSSFSAADAILEGTEAAFRKYEKSQMHELQVWQKLVNTWYSGGLFTLMTVGKERMDTSFGRFIGPHMQRHLTRIFTGEAVYKNYSRGFLRFILGPMIRWMKLGRLHNREISDLAIK
ncbi:MAG: NAD(P)/FAD-dependent oxidoreductase [Ferruginibacter sp.]|nr:NAD(P)/FAD-dependent oxidoreductase [Chitinophagaceae bacterium]MBP6286543.1 NAD(P)/FAD-dependent oxidoreductase [Ferruginibacter sp.]MBU9935501.1 NAD(P)/FAD-dependent oxidoreductase [Ferruginibacter sp.]HQY11812.1 NAD(P)/FAD-dependent oxidoreductase [Ferruginibacter sp.]